MKYKVGDKVIFNDGTTGVYTVSNIKEQSASPYCLVDYKGHGIGWHYEHNLSPAGNLIDSEEATEEFARLLDSGFYDESPIGITPEMMGAVVKGKEHKNVTLNIENIKKHESKFDIDTEDYDQGFKDGQASVAKAYAEGKGDEIERQQGRDEAWEVVKKLYTNPVLKQKCFDGKAFGYIIERMTSSEVIEKLKAYEEEQNAVKVGDEILDNRDEIGVVTEIGENFVSVLYANGHPYGVFGDNSKLRKTGRHFDQISEILEQMKEE